MQDGVHLFGDGHFDAVAGGEAEGGGGAADAFGDFAFEAGENFGQGTAFAEFGADGAVAGERSGAGEDEVADAGEAGESLAAASAGYGEAGHLGDAAGDEGGGGVVAEVEAVDYAGGEGDDILEGAAEFDSGDVIIGIEAERGRAELALDGEGYGGGGLRRQRWRWGCRRRLPRRRMGR